MKLKFTGHDTFPLRHGWLYKSISLIKNNGLLTVSDAKKAEQAITTLGVGKNMVNAIKYWAEVAQIIESKVVDRTIIQQTTPIGELLFNPSTGFDPYIEDIGTVWLIHFLMNFDDRNLSAYRYFFNYSNLIYFEKSKLIDDLYEDAFRHSNQGLDIDISEFSIKKATVKKDVDCFLATYCTKGATSASRKAGVVTEDYFASPLTEISLVRDLGRGFYQCDLDDRPTLPLNIFLYALVSFFNVTNEDSNSRTISFEDILSKPLSPGRIFKLSEAGLGRLLDEAVVATSNEVVWVDSLGLKQVAIDVSLLSEPLDLLSDYYRGKN